jgi:hypothetical protein
LNVSAGISPSIGAVLFEDLAHDAKHLKHVTPHGKPAVEQMARGLALGTVPDADLGPLIDYAVAAFGTVAGAGLVWPDQRNGDLVGFSVGLLARFVGFRGVYIPFFIHALFGV